MPLILLAAACVHAPRGASTGLFTSLPIHWPETGDIRELLASGNAPHWALAVLQARGAVRPIDSFLPGRGGSPLNGVATLVMAQPRPLAPQENIALDRWLRRGGRLLLFADPMLTSDSRFSLGDRRRPEDIVMLSPVLAHWGLRLEFDDEQPSGLHEVPIRDFTMPVNLPGRLVLDGTSWNCTILSGGLAADCAIGRGRALIVADAALFEDAAVPGESARRAQVLQRLLDGLFR